MSKAPLTLPKRDVVVRAYFRQGTTILNETVDNLAAGQSCQLTLEGHFLRVTKAGRACLVPLANVTSLLLESS